MYPYSFIFRHLLIVLRYFHDTKTQMRPPFLSRIIVLMTTYKTQIFSPNALRCNIFLTNNYIHYFDYKRIFRIH